MNITHNHTGGLTISEFVTDGTDTWLESITFYGYRTYEAAEEYSAEIARKGYEVAP